MNLKAIQEEGIFTSKCYQHYLNDTRLIKDRSRFVNKIKCFKMFKV